MASLGGVGRIYEGRAKRGQYRRWTVVGSEEVKMKIRLEMTVEMATGGVMAELVKGSERGPCALAWTPLLTASKTSEAV